MKWAGVAWRSGELNGPMMKNPVEKMTGDCSGNGDGLGENRLPDPPDVIKPRGNPRKCSDTYIQQPNMGGNGEEADKETAAPTAGDVAMEKADAANREVEVVRSTQF